MNYTDFHSVKSPNLQMLAGGSVMLSRANSILSKGADMKKTVTCQEPRRRRPEIDAALGKDLGQSIGNAARPRLSGVKRYVAGGQDRHLTAFAGHALASELRWGNIAQ